MSQKSSRMILQGTVLAAAGILTKIIGLVYRIPMANILGEEGNGIYSVSFGIYNVALTLSSYSFPLAVSKAISTRLAKKETKNAFRAFTVALLLSLFTGFLAFSFLFFGADLLESLYNTPGLAYPLRILAPTTFTVALLGVFRGYFQGHGNMVPTAISQVLEQIVNAIASIAATLAAFKIHSGSENIIAHGAAGATVGTLAGAICALTFVMLTFFSRLSYMRKAAQNDFSQTESKQSLLVEIIVTMLPIIISQTIYQISFTVDDLMFSNLLHSQGVSGTEISSLQGVFNTQYTQLINIPIAIASAMSASALPEIVRLSIRKRHADRALKAETVLKINMVIAIPCAVGLAIFATPIVTVIFPGLVSYRTVAANLLHFGSLGCVFYSLSTVTTSLLQGCNRMRIPVVNAFISFLFHTFLVFVLLKATHLGIWARLIGDVTFPLMIALLNFIQLRKKFNISPDCKTVFVYPFISSAIMGLLSGALYLVLSLLPIPQVISLGVAVIFAVALYALLLVKMSVFKESEYLQLPAGRKILNIARRIRPFKHYI